MKSCFVLPIISLALWVGVQGVWKCEQEQSAPSVNTFTGQRVVIHVPCKYNAVRQQCGQYNVTLSPGLIMVGKQDRLNTMWLGLRDRNDHKWEGRTTNKLAVKFLNGMTGSLFNKKNVRGPGTSEILRFSHNGTATFAEARDGSFRVTFMPWDPMNEDFQKSVWAFECFDESMTVVEYPKQTCGANESHGFGLDRTEVDANGLTPDQLFLYNLFTEKPTSVIQEDEQCLLVENILQNNCSSNKRRRDAIKTCTQIINSKEHRRCVTRYSCSSMHVFATCVQWVCGRYRNDKLCESLGSSIDMCREFKEGGLTEKVRQRNCYKDFIRILS